MSDSQSSKEKAISDSKDATIEQQVGEHGEIDSLEAILGYKAELQRNRSMFTLLFQSLAIAAIPYGEGKQS